MLLVLLLSCLHTWYYAIGALVVAVMTLLVIYSTINLDCYYLLLFIIIVPMRSLQKWSQASWLLLWPALVRQLDQNLVAHNRSKKYNERYLEKMLKQAKKKFTFSTVKGSTAREALNDVCKIKPPLNFSFRLHFIVAVKNSCCQVFVNYIN